MYIFLLPINFVVKQVQEKNSQLAKGKLPVDIYQYKNLINCVLLFIIIIINGFLLQQMEK